MCGEQALWGFEDDENDDAVVGENDLADRVALYSFF